MHPPPSPARTNFTLITECTPESSGWAVATLCCVLCGTDHPLTCNRSPIFISRFLCLLRLKFTCDWNVTTVLEQLQYVHCKIELYCFVSQFLRSYICERFIYFQNWSVYFAAAKYVGRSWKYINRSQTHECGNWYWGRAIPRKGIHKWDFHCSLATHRNSRSVLFVFGVCFLMGPSCKYRK